MSTQDFRIGTVVDILFNEGEITKPYEGVIIKIVHSEDPNNDPTYHISFSDGDYKVYLKSRLIQLTLNCKKWKKDNPYHIRGDPNQWGSKEYSIEDGMKYVEKSIKSIYSNV